MSSSNTVQRVPAWKRLGLKLKSASAVEEPITKRKQSPTEEAHLASKRAKVEVKESSNTTASVLHTPLLARKKSVAFTPETKIEDGDSIKQIFNGWVAEQKKQDPTFDFKNTNTNTALRTVEAPVVEEHIDPALDEKERKVKRTKTPKSSKVIKNAKKVPPTSTRPFLQYLQQYHTSRDTWKFNKNHQNHLLKHAFDLTVIPSDHVHFLYAYIRGLQGGVRIRLRDEALSVKVKDLEKGPSEFPADMANKDQKQLDYDIAMTEYIATLTAAGNDPEAGYEEGVLLGLSDKAMANRAARRMRSERILKELEETGTSLTDQRAHVEVEKPLDGAPKKLVRRRKQRTDVSDSSSSDSSSDSDSSSEEESETEAVTTAASDNLSSSSSSSDSSSGSSDDSSEEESDSD